MTIPDDIREKADVAANVVFRKGGFTFDHLSDAIAATILAEREATVRKWQPIGEDYPAPPHDVPVLLWSPPSMAHPNGLIEARPFSTGRRGIGWSEYSQHSWATHWMQLPEPPSFLQSEASAFPEVKL